jgi:hypothetical protein
MKSIEEIISEVVAKKNFKRIPFNNTGGQTVNCVKPEYEVSSDDFGITIKCLCLGNILKTEEYLTKLLINAVLFQLKIY